MKKKVECILLDTEQKNGVINKHLGADYKTSWLSPAKSGNQHLYFTSDEKIKDGDYGINLNTGSIFKVLSQDDEAYNCEFITGGHNISQCIYKNFGSAIPKKIVATTNPELTKKSFVICARIDDHFVEAYIKAYNAGKPITEVMLEYVKKRIGDEHDEFFFDTVKLRFGGTVIISLIIEKMYTRAEFLAGLEYMYVQGMEKQKTINELLTPRVNFKNIIDNRYPE